MSLYLEACVLEKTQLRHAGSPADLKMQGMPSFSLMMLPSFESATPSVFPSAFFFRNFLRSAWMASAHSVEVHTSSNNRGITL